MTRSRTELAAAARQPWLITWRVVMEAMGELAALEDAVCRECGCTWDEPCVLLSGDTCAWMHGEDPPLCSGCAA